MEKLRKKKVKEVLKNGSRERVKTHRLREEAGVLLQLHRKLHKQVIRPTDLPRRLSTGYL